MPVVSEPAAKDRKRGRGCLWVLAAVLGLLVVFLVGTMIRPVVVEAGGVVVCVGQWRYGRTHENGFHRDDLPADAVPVTTMTLNDRNYVQADTAYIRYVQIGTWGYGIVWFKGASVD